MQSAPSCAKEQASATPPLSEYLRALETERVDRHVVHLRFSLLKSAYRREQNLRTAAAGLTALAEAGKGHLFHLCNFDLVFIYAPDSEPRVERELKFIQALFADDPFVIASGSTDNGLFVHYGLEKKYQDFFDVVRGIQTGDQKPVNAGPARGGRTDFLSRRRKAVTFTPKLLHQLEAALEQAELASYMRRSPVYEVKADAPPSTLFAEWTISVFDLAAATIPNCNLTADPWLFKHFTELLDKRVLAILERPENMVRSGAVSINLNVSTLLSDAFFDFDEKLFTGRHEETVIEIKAADVFHDLATFRLASRFVRSKGYRLCLDGVTQWTIDLIEREELGFDYIKLQCDPLLLIDAESKLSWLRDAVDRAGDNKFIFCFVDTPEALMLGQSAGVRYFQGRHIGKVLNAAR